MFSFKKAAAAFAAVGGLTLVTGIGQASAATTPVFPGSNGATASYGFDGNAHLIAGGGSDTTYRVMQSLADLWGGSASSSVSQCVTNKTADGFTSGGTYPPSSPALAQCSPATQSFAPTNYDADTVTNADPAGSSAGIESLNGFLHGTGSGIYPYEGTNQTISTASGTVNGFGTPDFARSSRGPTLNGGQCAATGPAPNSYPDDELACDTFWGFAEDGVEVTLFSANGTGPAGDSINLTPAQIDGIWNCTITDWNTIDSAIPAGTPIVPWSMNTSSGTYATFNSLVAAQAPDSTFSADANIPGGSTGKTCVRTLANPALGATGSNGRNPFENDIKSFVNDAQNFADDRPGVTSTAGLSTTASSTQDPANWIWFSSFGLLSTFPYDAAVTVGGVAVATSAASISGTAPSAGNVALGRYPFNRTLYYVTPKADADCPTNPNQAVSTSSSLNPLNCDFTTNLSAATPYCNAVNNPNGGAELDVLASPVTYTTSNCNGTASGAVQTPVQAGTTGSAGAVREFTRFICRSSTDQAGIDPFTGIGYGTEISGALTASGFTTVPHSGTAGSARNLVSPGSSCEVISQG